MIFLRNTLFDASLLCSPIKCIERHSKWYRSLALMSKSTKCIEKVHHCVEKFFKKSHCYRSEQLFIFLLIVDFLPFLCSEVNVESQNWPFYFGNFKGFQVYSTLSSLHKKGKKSTIDKQKIQNYEFGPQITFVSKINIRIFGTFLQWFSTTFWGENLFVIGFNDPDFTTVSLKHSTLIGALKFYCIYFSFCWLLLYSVLFFISSSFHSKRFFHAEETIKEGQNLVEAAWPQPNRCYHKEGL